MYKYSKKIYQRDKFIYNYSQFDKNKFIVSWKTDRKKFMRINPYKSYKNLSKKRLLLIFSYLNTKFKKNVSILDHFDKLIRNFEKKVVIRKQFSKRILKDFEITKKVYINYTKDLKPIKTDQKQDVDSLILAGAIFAINYISSKELPYLNALLKLNDIISSKYDEIDEQQVFVEYLFIYELYFFEKLEKGNAR